MNIPEWCDFPDCDCAGPERCEAKPGVTEVISVPRDGWMVKLAEGWQLAEGAHAHQGHDGAYVVRMWRPA